jgi:Fe-S cluster assembly protein SufB
LEEKIYPYGFVTEVESERIPPGLSVATIEAISAKKQEPVWMLEFRLNAFSQWQAMQEPTWANFHCNPIDFNALCYYSAPKKRAKNNQLQEVDPELLRTFQRLNIPVHEHEHLAGVAIDLVFDSSSVITAFRQKLQEVGVILCPISEAIRQYPDLVRPALASVVPVKDNFYAALNSAVFSDGSFVYVPKGVVCPLELSTYFRLNDKNVGQFERTLIIAEEGASVSYLEGCTAPAHSEHQLHAAVVEVIAEAGAHVRYATVQNWYAGDDKGIGGVYNFVTKRGLCRGKRSKISWTQVEAGAAITWKYPGCILQGEESVGEFYSVAVTRGKMQADTGTKMIHIGKNSRSTIIAKSIATEASTNVYRGLVSAAQGAVGARSYTRCDSLLVGKKAATHTYPTIVSDQPTAQFEHEASTSKLSEEQLLYVRSRGIPVEEAVGVIVSGFCKRVLQRLPLEFAKEAEQLLALTLERSLA